MLHYRYTGDELAAREYKKQADLALEKHNTYTELNGLNPSKTFMRLDPTGQSFIRCETIFNETIVTVYVPPKPSPKGKKRVETTVIRELVPIIELYDGSWIEYVWRLVPVKLQCFDGLKAASQIQDTGNPVVYHMNFEYYTVTDKMDLTSYGNQGEKNIKVTVKELERISIEEIGPRHRSEGESNLDAGMIPDEGYDGDWEWLNNDEGHRDWYFDAALQVIWPSDGYHRCHEINDVTETFYIDFFNPDDDIWDWYYQSLYTEPSWSYYYQELIDFYRVSPAPGYYFLHIKESVYPNLRETNEIYTSHGNSLWAWGAAFDTAIPWPFENELRYKKFDTWMVFIEEESMNYDLVGHRLETWEDFFDYQVKTIESNTIGEQGGGIRTWMGYLDYYMLVDDDVDGQHKFYLGSIDRSDLSVAYNTRLDMRMIPLCVRIYDFAGSPVYAFSWHNNIDETVTYAYVYKDEIFKSDPFPSEASTGTYLGMYSHDFFGCEAKGLWANGNIRMGIKTTYTTQTIDE